ncbi:MAG: hypothetical protein DMF81_26855 [Acidobacteria bacterium]|nr:MAG: hypothetical protein DMF81_26855 [Acidobacteriota bacterium]
MSKTPTLAPRVAAFGDALPAAGAFLVRGDELEVRTRGRHELVDLTGRIREFVRPLGIRDGLVHVWSLHTTCAVFVSELQEALGQDIAQLMESLAPRESAWLHNDPRHSDCDRRNADAHLRTMLLGHSVTVRLGGGELGLGEWQRVLLGEFDGPRSRTVSLQASGIA